MYVQIDAGNTYANIATCFVSRRKKKEFHEGGWRVEGDEREREREKEKKKRTCVNHLELVRSRAEDFTSGELSNVR